MAHMGISLLSLWVETCFECKKKCPFQTCGDHDLAEFLVKNLNDKTFVYALFCLFLVCLNLDNVYIMLSFYPLQ